jgi:hypothetical protein
MFASEQRGTVSSAVAQKARLSLPAARKFYAIFVEPSILPLALIAPASGVPAGSVPLFKAHCSFLV